MQSNAELLFRLDPCTKMKLGNGAYITRALSRIIFSFYYWGRQSGNFSALNYDNSGQRQISQPQIKTRSKRGYECSFL